jgi:hypothetical protein
VPVAGGNLQSAIDFNNAHAAAEMPTSARRSSFKRKPSTSIRTSARRASRQRFCRRRPCMSYNDVRCAKRRTNNPRP